MSRGRKKGTKTFPPLSDAVREVIGWRSGKDTLALFGIDFDGAVAELVLTVYANEEIEKRTPTEPVEFGPTRNVIPGYMAKMAFRLQEAVDAANRVGDDSFKAQVKDLLDRLHRHDLIVRGESPQRPPKNTTALCILHQWALLHRRLQGPPTMPELIEAAQIVDPAISRDDVRNTCTRLDLEYMPGKRGRRPKG